MTGAAGALQILKTNHFNFPSRMKPSTEEKWLEKELKFSRTGLIKANKREEPNKSGEQEKSQPVSQNNEAIYFFNTLQKQ